ARELRSREKHLVLRLAFGGKEGRSRIAIEEHRRARLVRIESEEPSARLEDAQPFAKRLRARLGRVEVVEHSGVEDVVEARVGEPGSADVADEICLALGLLLRARDQTGGD